MGLTISGFKRKRFLRLLGTLLIAIGVALLGLWGAYYAYAKVSEAQLQSLVKKEQPVEIVPLPSPTATSQASAEATPTPRPSPTSTPWASLDASVNEEKDMWPPSELDYFLYEPLEFPPATRIVIPSIGVDSKVVEIGTKYNEKGELVWETAAFAVGHHQDTANPGEAGKIVMSGHISSPLSHEGDVFRRLPEIELGDEITLYTLKDEFRYRVTETDVVLPTEVNIMDPSSEPTLILITCVPDWVYTHRLVVTAKPY